MWIARRSALVRSVTGNGSAYAGSAGGGEAPSAESSTTSASRRERCASSAARASRRAAPSRRTPIGPYAKIAACSAASAAANPVTPAPPRASRGPQRSSRAARRGGRGPHGTPDRRPLTGLLPPPAARRAGADVAAGRPGRRWGRRREWPTALGAPALDPGEFAARAVGPGQRLESGGELGAGRDGRPALAASSNAPGASTRLVDRAWGQRVGSGSRRAGATGERRAGTPSAAADRARRRRTRPIPAPRRRRSGFLLRTRANQTTVPRRGAAGAIPARPARAGRARWLLTAMADRRVAPRRPAGRPPGAVSRAAYRRAGLGLR